MLRAELPRPPSTPSGLRLEGRPVVVVGGGQVAHRRVAGLLDAGARVTVVSPALTPALEALVEPRVGDLAAARATNPATSTEPGTRSPRPTTRAVNAAVAAEAEQARIFCARADDRRASSVWTPAVGRRGDLVIGVHGGGDPQRAVAVRDAVVSGLTDGSIPDRARRVPADGRPAASCWWAAAPATRD